MYFELLLLMFWPLLYVYMCVGSLTFSSAAKLKLGLLFWTFVFPRGDVLATLPADRISAGAGAGAFSLIGSGRNKKSVQSLIYTYIHTYIHKNSHIHQHTYIHDRETY